MYYLSNSNSLWKHVGDYKTEMYNLQILGYEGLNISVDVEIRIYGEGDDARFMGLFELMKEDESTTGGHCMNRPTKEETMRAVEKSIIRILEKDDHPWIEPKGGFTVTRLPKETND